MPLLCFDLDGTLVDPLEGMLLCLRATCQDVGIPCPDPAQVARTIGLDLEDLFLALPSPRRREATERYWRLFAEEGVFAQRVLEGVPLLLARLKRQGHRLILVTNHSGTLARRTLHQFDLSLIFDDVLGLRPLEAWQPKGKIMEHLRREGAFGAGGYLIGDRADDMCAAQVHGLQAVGVAYGCGTREELTEAHADIVLDSVPALAGWLEKELTEPEVHDPFSRSE